MEHILYRYSMEHEIQIQENMNDCLMDIGIIETYMTEADQESKIKKIFDRIVKMLKSLASSIKTYSEKLAKKVVEKLSTAKAKVAIARIKKMKSNKPIKFIDVWKYEKTLKEEAKALSKLCNKWLREYTAAGKNVRQANKFEDKFNHIARQYEEKLDQIKKTKIKVPANKAAKWLLDNVGKGCEAQGTIKIYKDQIDDCIKVLESTKIRKEAFIKETGYDDGPASFTKVVNNGWTYVKRNADWISMFLVSSVLQIAAFQQEMTGKQNLNELLTGTQDYEDRSDEDKESYVNTIYNANSYKGKNKMISKGLQKASMTVAAMGTYTKGMAHKRNSI